MRARLAWVVTLAMTLTAGGLGETAPPQNPAEGAGVPIGPATAELPTAAR